MIFVHNKIDVSLPVFGFYKNEADVTSIEKYFVRKSVSQAQLHPLYQTWKKKKSPKAGKRQSHELACHVQIQCLRGQSSGHYCTM